MAKVLTPDAAGRELAKVLRLAAQKEEQLKDITKERKGEIAKLMKRARELQGIALGDAQQVELPTEPDPEPEASPAAAAEVLGKKGRGKGKREHLVRCPNITCQKIHRTGDFIPEDCRAVMNPEQLAQLEPPPHVEVPDGSGR